MKKVRSIQVILFSKSSPPSLYIMELYVDPSLSDGVYRGLSFRMVEVIEIK